MKLTAIFFITAILLLLATEIQSQDFQIVQDNKTKTFKAGSFIRVDLPVNAPKDCKPCPKNYVAGRLISFKNDTLKLQVRYEDQSISENGKEIGTQTKSYVDKKENEWPFLDLPKKEIWGITKQGTRKWTPVHPGDVVGGLLTFAGVLTGFSYFAANGENNEDALQETSLILIGTGIATSLVFNRKAYHTENDPDPKDKYKMWNIK